MRPSKRQLNRADTCATDNPAGAHRVSVSLIIHCVGVAAAASSADTPRLRATQRYTSHRGWGEVAPPDDIIVCRIETHRARQAHPAAVSRRVER